MSQDRIVSNAGRPCSRTLQLVPVAQRFVVPLEHLRELSEVSLQRACSQRHRLRALVFQPHHMSGDVRLKMRPQLVHSPALRSNSPRYRLGVDHNVSAAFG